MTTPIKPGESVRVHVDGPSGVAYDEVFTAADAPTPPPVVSAPGAPKSLVATPGDGTISLVWMTPGGPVTGYNIYRDGVNVSTQPGATFTDSGLKNGQAYNYAVAAVNAIGEGSVARVKATPVAPPVIVPVPPDHWATAFGGYPNSPNINDTSGGTGLLEIANKTFRGPVGTGAAVRVQYRRGGVIWIHDCDFVDLDWSALNILSCTCTLIIEWCRYRNVTRNFAQIATQSVLGSDATHGSSRLSDNKGIGGKTEDLINVYQSGGKSASERLLIERNQFEGTNWDSGSGSGFMVVDAGGGGYVDMRQNKLLNIGQVGIGVNNGHNVRAIQNDIYSAPITRPIPGAPGWVGIYTPYGGYNAENPGNHEVSGNRIWFQRPDGSHNELWDGGASGPVAGLSPQTNLFGKAATDAGLDPAKMHVTL